jgi:membrane-bound serine protease (ClpP class)
LSNLLIALAAVTATQVSPETAGSVAATEPDVTIPLLFFGGLILILMETAVPGGVLGVLGAMLLLLAVIITTRDHGGQMGLLLLAGGLIGSIVIIGVGWHYLPKTSLGRALFLTPSTGQQTEPVTTEAKAKAAIKPGDEGESVTDLRPAGVAKIGDWRVDVVTRGEYVEQATPVVVIALDGTRVVVRAKAAQGGDEV